MKSKSMRQLAREHGIDRSTVANRIRKGWDLHRALTEPLGAAIQPRIGKDIPCDECGKVVYRKPSRINRNGNNFCSRECLFLKIKDVLRNCRGTPEERFWEKVHKTDGCWFWTGAVNKNGYGSFGFEGKSETASRFAWFIYTGERLPPEQLVCHTCDTPLCVRGDHLFVGSNMDNRIDCVIKGRANGAVGERNTKAKLTVADVLIIRSSPLPTRPLADRFGVKTSTILKIKRHILWKHTGDTECPLAQ